MLKSFIYVFTATPKRIKICLAICYLLLLNFSGNILVMQVLQTQSKELIQTITENHYTDSTLNNLLIAGTFFNLGLALGTLAIVMFLIKTLRYYQSKDS